MGKQAKPKSEAKKVPVEVKKAEDDAAAKEKAAQEAEAAAEVAAKAQQEARDKMKQKFDAVRTGGKGTVRRKKKAQHKTSAADDKQLQAQLKRLQVNNIPGIEEVNMFKEDGNVIHFSAPKVQASIAANTYVISGHAENKQLQELLPGIINQLGPDNLMNLKRIAESYNAGAAVNSGAAQGGDDDVPDIDENFEDVSKK